MITCAELGNIRNVKVIGPTAGMSNAAGQAFPAVRKIQS